MADEAFPRGGGQGDISALEYRELSAKARRDASREESTEETGDGGLKHKKSAKADKKKKPSGKGGKGTKGKRSSDKGKKQEVRGGLSAKRMNKGMLVLACVRDVHDTHMLVSMPNLLTGIVRLNDIREDSDDTHESDEDSDADVQMDDDAEDDMDAEEKIPTFDTKLQLREAYKPGQMLLASVISVDESGGKKNYRLSLRPSAVNSKLGEASVSVGRLLWVSVEAKEDHGYVMNSGVEGVKVFLTTAAAKAYLDAHGRSSLYVGECLACSVVTGHKRGKVVQVTIDPSKVTSSAAKGTGQYMLSDLTPGLKVSAVVTHAAHKSVAFKFNDFEATADQFHLLHTKYDVDPGPDSAANETQYTTDLAKTYKEGDKHSARILFLDVENKIIGLTLRPDIVKGFKGTATTIDIGCRLQECRVARVDSGVGLLLAVPTDAPTGETTGVRYGYVHISRVSDGHVDSLVGRYKPGTVHKARVLGYSSIDGVHQLSMQKSIFDQEYLRAEDAVPGALVTVTVREVAAFGMLVTLSEFVKALCPVSHLSDVRLSHPEKKFKHGTQIQCRVLSCTTRGSRKRLLMTARRSLVKSKLPTIASYEEVDPGTVTLGVVTAVRHFGTIVTFYNNVKGIVPAGTLGATEHTVGQTVKCKVLNTDPARQRMKLSFDLNADVSVVATTGGNTAAAVAGVAVGSVVAATVVGVLADRLNVELTESGARGSILASHLSDHACFFVPPQDPAAAADYTPITARFSKGDVLKKVLVVAKEGPTKNRLVLSMKPCLLQYAKELDTPVTELQDLVAGQTHMGYIRSTTSLGCFVGLVHGLVGLVSVQDLSERFIDDPAKHFASGQTVAIVVKSFNVEKNRAYFSLKGADELLQQYSPSLVRSYFAELDKHSCDAAATEAFMQLKCGAKAKIRVLSVQAGVGASVQGVDSGFEGLVLARHLEDKAPAVDSTHTARVLDKNFATGVVDLSLRNDVVKAAKGATSPDVNTAHTAVILLVKNNHLVVMLAGGKIAFALTATLHEQQASSFSRYTAGHNVDVVVAAKAGGRILCTVTSPPRGTRGPGNNAELREHAAATVETMRTPGTRVEAVVKAVKEMQLNVTLAPRVHGRVHITEMEDTSLDMDLNAPSPLAAFKVGDAIEARVVGLHNIKTHKNLAITHKWNMKTMIDCSMKPSKLALKAGKPFPAQLDATSLKTGAKCVAYVQKVTNTEVIVCVTPRVLGRIPALLASTDAKVAKNLSSNFSRGQRVICTIVKAMKEGADSGKETHRIIDMAITGEPKVGTTVLARVYRVLPTAAGMSVQLGNKDHGRIAATNIADKFSKTPFKGIKVGSVVQCHVISKTKRKGSNFWELSLRKSHLLGVGEVSDPVITSMADVEKDHVYRGYIVNTTDNGCYVALGPDIVGRVQIANLSDAFVKDFQAAFPVGMRVCARVINYDSKSKRLELSLKPSVVNPENFQEPLTLVKLSVGDKVKGHVKRVETYGVFVQLDNSTLSGLCHISEVSKEFIADLKTLFKEGDRVKTLITKIDNGKISLSLKPEHFQGDVDSDAEDEDEAETAETDSDTDSDADDAAVDDENTHAAGADDDEVDSDGDDDDDDDTDDDDVEGVLDVDAGDDDESAYDSAARLARKRKFSDVPALDLGAVFADDDNDAADAMAVDSSSESEDEDESTAVSKKLSKRAKRAAKVDEERKTREEESKIADATVDNLTSAEAFDREVLGNPNDSYVWVKYIAFHLQMSEIDKAREVAERALRTISTREEGERMNIWIAKINLEFTYGTEESLKSVFDEAQRMNDCLKMHQHMVAIYERNNRVEDADKLYQVICRKFKENVAVWVNYGSFKLKQGKSEQARVVLQNSLKALPKADHILIINKFAVMDFRNGEVERGRTIFENLLSNYPKRLDLWNVYIDQELRVGNHAVIRALFERVTSLNLSSKKMKFFFKKYLEFEKTEGDEDTVEHVKQAARAYIESKMK